MFHNQENKKEHQLNTMCITMPHTWTELANLTETERGKNWPEKWNETRLGLGLQQHKLKKHKRKTKKGNKNSSNISGNLGC